MLTRLEQETIILFNEEEKTASVYTHNAKLTEKLRRMAEKFPNQVYPERREHPGAVSYIVPKGCISVREPYSEQRRKALSEWAKAEGVRPPCGGSK
jgi:hypothetical protein